MQHGPGMHMGSMKKKLVSYTVALKSKKQIAEGTYAFTFEKPAEFRFLAGQHIRMTLIDSPETDAEGDKRFLTMASTPQEPDLVFAMRMRDTAFKRNLSRMQPGEKVIIQKLIGESPKGSFVLHEDPAKPAVFITGGIGIVPAYAMIKDALQRRLPHQLSLFYSNRRPEDAPFLAELQKMAAQNANFRLIATITEPEKSATGWDGQTGVINQALLEKYVNDLQTPIYYVAGLPAMVSAMKTLLFSAGVNETNVHAEEFTGFNLNEIKDTPGRTWKNYALVVLVGILLAALLLAHAGVISLSLDSPISYLLFGGLSLLVAFKIFALLKLRYMVRSKQGNMTTKNMLEAHKLRKR